MRKWYYLQPPSRSPKKQNKKNKIFCLVDWQVGKIFQYKNFTKKYTLKIFCFWIRIIVSKCSELSNYSFEENFKCLKTLQSWNMWLNFLNT